MNNNNNDYILSVFNEDILTEFLNVLSFYINDDDYIKTTDFKKKRSFDNDFKDLKNMKGIDFCDKIINYIDLMESVESETDQQSNQYQNMLRREILRKKRMDNNVAPAAPAVEEAAADAAPAPAAAPAVEGAPATPVAEGATAEGAATKGTDKQDFNCSIFEGVPVEGAPVEEAATKGTDEQDFICSIFEGVPVEEAV